MGEQYRSYLEYDDKSQKRDLFIVPLKREAADRSRESQDLIDKYAEADVLPPGWERQLALEQAALLREQARRIEEALNNSA